MGDKSDKNKDINEIKDLSLEAKSDEPKNKKHPYYTPLNSGNKFGVFFSSLSTSSVISLVILAIIVAALPFYVFTSQKRQDLRQRASGGAYLTVYPNNANRGDKIIITETGPADCAEGLTEPQTEPLSGLTNCELINASTNCTDNCQITWQCAAGTANSYVVNVKSDKCDAKAYLNIKNKTGTKP